VLRGGRVAGDGAAAHATVGDAERREDLLDVVELAVVQDQDRDALGHGTLLPLAGAGAGPSRIGRKLPCL
jgi:hypothetical protein